MKKFLTGMAATTLLVAPFVVLAQREQEPPPAIDIWVILESIRDYLFGIFIFAAVIFFVIAAFYFLTAQGDPEKVRKARNFVLYALIGVAVAVASRGLVALVCDIFWPGWCRV